MEIKNKIIEGATTLFHKYGVRSVSMDDIARYLSMSKKTLYQYFKDKDELVTLGMRAHMEQEKSEFEEIVDHADNAIHEMASVTKLMRKNMKDINPSLLYDLQKYHPNAWNVWLDFKDNYIKDSVVSTLRRGVEQGLFRDEIDPEIMAIFRVEQVQMAFNDQVFPSDKFNFKEVQISFLDHFIYGLVNDKGRVLFQKYLDQETKTNSIEQHEN
ncbi:MAG: TetR/AcrR family transcriptional regulator [Bacteroidota bacterium]